MISDSELGNQITIFDAIQESNIENLMKILNEDLSPKDKYTLILKESIQDNNTLLVAKNSSNVLLNIVNKDGFAPSGFCVNWRDSTTIMSEFKNTIPEPVLIIKIFETNINLIKQGKDVESFWKQKILKK